MTTPIKIKLYFFPLQYNLVSRLILVSLITDGVMEKLPLVIAPAGFGKAVPQYP